MEIKDFLWEFMKQVAPFTEAEKTQLGLPVSCRTCLYQMGLTGLRKLATLGLPRCPIGTQTAGSWKKNLQKQRERGDKPIGLISNCVASVIIHNQHHQPDFNQLTRLTGSSGSESTSLSCLYMKRRSIRSMVLERFRNDSYASTMRS